MFRLKEGIKILVKLNFANFYLLVQLPPVFGPTTNWLITADWASHGRALREGKYGGAEMNIMDRMFLNIKACNWFLLDLQYKSIHTMNIKCWLI